MKVYKTEIRPNKEQIELIHQTFGNTRYVYNQFITLNFERLNANEDIISGYSYSKMINNDPERPDWLTKSPSKAIKQAIMNADKALQSILKRKPSFIVIEDLNVKGLMKNRHLSKAISKAQWYQSRVFLQHQCEKLGIELRLVSRFYPSSKLCSHCGYKNVNLKLKDRSWECPNCHVVHDRDENASINLERCAKYTVLTAV